jgi:hypothetical protein
VGYYGYCVIEDVTVNYIISTYFIYIGQNFHNKWITVIVEVKWRRNMYVHTKIGIKRGNSCQ